MTEKKLHPEGTFNKCTFLHFSEPRLSTIREEACLMSGKFKTEEGEIFCSNFGAIETIMMMREAEEFFRTLTYAVHVYHRTHKGQVFTSARAIVEKDPRS